MSKSVLVVEDDPDISELLCIHLGDLGCAPVEVAVTGDRGLQMGLSRSWDLIILDITLPGIDGTEVCRRLRGKEVTTPILMLTARSEEFDKVLGLEMGADDYVTKPFSIRELMARVRALLRRAARTQLRSPATNHNVLRRGELSIDTDRRRVTVANRRIDLSPKEFELLNLLATNPGKPYDRASLLNLIWGYDFDGYEHTVNSHINRLRTKIEPDPAKPTYVLTNWGVGYRFNEDL